MADLNPAIDFLDVLSADIPKGETRVQPSPHWRIAPHQVVSHFIGFVPSISEHGYLSWGAFLLNNCIQQNWHINWMLKFDRNLGWSNAISFCELCFIGILNLNLFEIF